MFLFKNMLLCDKDLIKVNNFSIVAIRIQSDPIILPDPDSATYLRVFFIKICYNICLMLLFSTCILKDIHQKKKKKNFNIKSITENCVRFIFEYLRIRVRFKLIRISFKFILILFKLI